MPESPQLSRCDRILKELLEVENAIQRLKTMSEWAVGASDDGRAFTGELSFRIPLLGAEAAETEEDGAVASIESV